MTTLTGLLLSNATTAAVPVQGPAQQPNEVGQPPNQWNCSCSGANPCQPLNPPAGGQASTTAQAEDRPETNTTQPRPENYADMVWAQRCSEVEGIDSLMREKLGLTRQRSNSDTAPGPFELDVHGGIARDTGEPLRTPHSNSQAQELNLRAMMRIMDRKKRARRR